jgi:hypothetical protein
MEQDFGKIGRPGCQGFLKSLGVAGLRTLDKQAAVLMY